MPLPLRKDSGAEYEPLNASGDVESSEAWTEKQTVAPPQSPSPLFLWSICIVALLSVVNVALFPGTVSHKALYFSLNDLPEIGSIPPFTRVPPEEALANYTLSVPERLAQVDVKSDLAVFNKSRMTDINWEVRCLTLLFT